MRLVVDLFHALGGDVRIHLGGDQVRVSKKLLHGAQVGAVVQEVGGERVAQGVRRGLQAFRGGTEVLVEGAANAAVGEATTELIQKDGRIGRALVFGGEFRAAVPQVGAHRLHGGAAHQGNALLIALAVPD